MPSLIPSETITELQSAASAADSKKPALFFVHAIEGFVTSLKKLASLLPYKIYGVECTKDAPVDSIESLSAYYIQVFIIFYFDRIK